MTLCVRVYEDLLKLLPNGIKVIDLTKADFQSYLTYRKKQVNKHTGDKVKVSTIFKEMYAIRGCLSKAEDFFPELENYEPPKLPKDKKYKPKQRRERLVTEEEFLAVVGELRKPPEGKQTFKNHVARIRLADYLVFAMETGLRRKEAFALKFSQFNEEKKCLMNVRRFKTNTVNKFIPLSEIAFGIIVGRRKSQGGSEYIFSDDGRPLESMYRTLRKVCKKLGIEYGRYKSGGFVPHDLRHNFGTRIAQKTDMETTRILMGHSEISQTQTYVHTDEKRLSEAVRQNKDIEKKLKKIFRQIKKGKLNESDFINKVKEFIG